MLKELARGTALPLILRILAEGPQHGYGLIQSIRQRSGAALEFTEGTVYPLLHGMERDGLVAGRWDTLPSGRRRRVYEITPAGRERLAAAVDHWRTFRAAVDRILGQGEVSPGHG